MVEREAFVELTGNDPEEPCQKEGKFIMPITTFKGGIKIVGTMR